MVARAIDRRKHFVAVVLWLCGVAGWVACASPQTQPVNRSSAQEVLSGVEVDREGESTVVTLVGLSNPVYAAGIGDDAILVVDLTGVRVEAGDGDPEANQVFVYDGVVNEVSVSSYAGYDGSDSARIEVSLAGDATYDTEVGSRGLVLRIHPGLAGDDLAMAEGAPDWGDDALDTDGLWSSDAAPVDEGEGATEEVAQEMLPMTPATKLVSVAHEVVGDGILVHLLANGVIESTETFALENPQRLVVDLPGIENGAPKAAYAVESGLVAKVRVGAHPGKLRVVVDGGAEAAGFEGRSMTPVADGLYIALGAGAELEESLAAAIDRSNASLMVAAAPEIEEGFEAAVLAEGDSAEPADAAWDAETDPALAGIEKSEVDEWDAAVADVDETEAQEAADASAEFAETAPEEAPQTHGDPIQVFGVNFDATGERDRLAILSDSPIDYEVYSPDAETLVLRLENSQIVDEAEGHIERDSQGPTSLISAFQQPEVENEVRVVVTRAAGLEPAISRRGNILVVDFPNTGAMAAFPPAFAGEHMAATSGVTAGAMADELQSATVVEEGVETLGGKVDVLESAAADPVEVASAPASLETPSATPAAGQGTAFAGPAKLDEQWAPADLAPEAVEAPFGGPGIPTADAAPAALASLEGPAAVELLQEGGLVDGKAYRGRRISLDFKSVPVADVLRLIAEVSDLNIIAGQEVKGSVTLRLVDVPWDQALDVILLTRGLGFVRVGNVLRIAPADVIKVEEEVRLQERRNREKLEDLEVKLIPVNYASADEILGMVTRVLSARGTVDIDSRTNTLIVKDIKVVIDEATALIRALDTETPQVVIEAKIVEAALDFRRELGSEWGISTNQFDDAATEEGVRVVGGEHVKFINENSLVFSNPINSASTGALNLGALILNDDFNVDVSIQAAESSGNGKVISSPRVVTLDNRTAKIAQGVSIPFQTFEGGDAKLQFVDAVLSLEVTPHVTANDSVFMKVKVKRNAPDDSVATPTGSPAIAKNEAETETMVKNGQTMVLGGIYTLIKSESSSRVPYLHKIPVIGNAFKNRRVTDTRKELLVFITPRIVPKVDL